MTFLSNGCIRSGSKDISLAIWSASPTRRSSEANFKIEGEENV